MDKNLIESIVSKVIDEIKALKKHIRVEASGRHVHLSKEDAIKLFGTETLTPLKELSQPGQYLCKEKVRIIGPKGDFKEVAVLGPVRDMTQVEVSMTDARALGIKPVVRDSGDIKNCPTLWIQGKYGMIEAKSSVIVARRHIHMTLDDAKAFNLKDKDEVSVRVYGERKIIFEDVLVRVNPRFSLSMHIDYDEANAVGLSKDAYGEILEKQAK